MKKMFKGLFILVLMISLVGCGDKKEGDLKKNDDKSSSSSKVVEYDGFKKYEHSSFGFSYPEDWDAPEKLPDVGYDNVALIFPDGSTNINVIVEPLPKEYTLDAYYKASITGLTSSLGVKESDIKTTDKTFNGIKAKVLRYEYSGLMTIEQIIFTPANKKAFVLTYTALKSNFEKDYDKVEKIYNSFAILG